MRGRIFQDFKVWLLVCACVSRTLPDPKNVDNNQSRSRLDGRPVDLHCNRLVIISYGIRLVELTKDNTRSGNTSRTERVAAVNDKVRSCPRRLWRGSSCCRRRLHVRNDSSCSRVRRGATTPDYIIRRGEYHTGDVKQLSVITNNEGILTSRGDQLPVSASFCIDYQRCGGSPCFVLQMVGIDVPSTWPAIVFL